MKIVSIYVGKESTLYNSTESQSVQTGIDKKELSSVCVSEYGCEGDENVFEVHGGPDRAILGYSADDYEKARKEFPGTKFPHPSFGENLLVDGINEHTVTLGEVWRIGSQVRLQVTMPRKACFKLDWRHCSGVKDWTNGKGKGGWFLRCLTPGIINKGDLVEIEERPFPSISVVTLRNPLSLSPSTIEGLVSDESPLGEEWKTFLRSSRPKNQRTWTPPFLSVLLCVLVGIATFLFT